MKKNTKRSLLILVLLLAIGFAAVTTTLYLNGTITLGENTDNFEQNIVFTKASLTYSDTNKTAITDVTGEGNDGDKLRILDNGKKISFTTETLTDIDETATLTYDITNNSQYGAEFTGITCTVKDEAGTDVTSSVTAENEYIKLTAQDFKNGEANVQLAKNSTLAGRTLEIKQRKSYVGTDTSTEKQYNIECTINASGLSANK